MAKIVNYFKEFILADLFRYEESTRLQVFLKAFFISHLGFRLSFWYRIANYFYINKNVFLYRLFRLYFNRKSRKFGIDIPCETEIGPGLYMPHPIEIIINANTKIGKNCNIHQDVTIGESPKGRYKGSPSLGSNIYIGPGAKIFGKINIGDSVAIGANCVVNKDVPKSAVVVGIPFKIISYNGSDGYVRRIIHS